MPFFFIQVQTNYEKYVLNLIANSVINEGDNAIKSIYALDLHVDFSNGVDYEAIRQFLKEKRLRAYLNNMRYTYAEMRKNKHIGENIKKSYRKQIKSLQDEVKNLPVREQNKGEALYIRGYIIIGTYPTYDRMTSDVYYKLKATPKVIAVLNQTGLSNEELKPYLSYFKTQ